MVETDRRNDLVGGMCTDRQAEDCVRRRPGAWRRVGAALRAVATFALLAPLAGCADDLPTAVELAPRTGEDLSPEQLARAVEERIVSGDFVEPSEDRLVLEVRGNLLFAKGVVNGDSERETVAMLNDSPGVRTAVFTMVLGSADDETNVALGRKLRNAGMTTYLPARGLVASGGADLFLSGVRRIVECGAHMGVHSWAFGSVNGNELPRDDPRHRFYLDYYLDIGIPRAFYWFTLQAAAPDSIHWMTEDEMVLYEVYTHFLGSCGQGSPGDSVRIGRFGTIPVRLSDRIHDRVGRIDFGVERLAHSHAAQAAVNPAFRKHIPANIRRTLRE